MKGNERYWEGDNRKNNKGGDRTGCKNLKQRRESSNASACKGIPKGDEDELKEAYEIVSTYQATILDYANKEDMPQEVIDYHRRIFHFAKYGPRKGFFKLYPNSKLVSADVLYILSAKIPRRLMAEKFKVSEETIAGIMKGGDRDWLDEYYLVRRLKKALTGTYKKNWSDTHITLLTERSTKEVIAIFSSPKKAREYRKTFLIYKRKVGIEKINAMIKSGEIEHHFPIEERVVTE